MIQKINRFQVQQQRWISGAPESRFHGRGCQACASLLFRPADDAGPRVARPSFLFVMKRCSWAVCEGSITFFLSCYSESGVFSALQRYYQIEGI